MDPLFSGGALSSRLPAPPRLLVSVRDADEAAAALAGGCDLLDVKEPARGPLGRAEPDTIAAIAAARDHLSPATPLSVALGELCEWRDGPPRGWRPLPSGVQFVKAGLAGLREVPDWPDHWRRLQSLVASESITPAWVAVAYADDKAARAPVWPEVVAAAADLSCRALLLDTWGKSSGRLFDWIDDGELEACAAACREHDLLLALAGRLHPADLARAAAFAPDVIAVRSAACRNEERSGPIDPIRVAQLRHGLQSIAPARNDRVPSR